MSSFCSAARTTVNNRNDSGQAGHAKRVQIIGTGSTVVRLDARIMPSTAHYSVNGECFAYHPVQQPQVIAVPVYRTRAA